MSDSIGNSFGDIIICPLGESGISYEELHEFVVRVFKERLEQGLNFKVANSTLERFIAYIKNNDSHVFVAIDNGSHELVGTSTIIFRSRKGVLFGHHGLWAVSLQGRGIGSQLVKEEIEYAKTKGVQYVESDTAEGAESSVRAHMKSGFIKAGYYSFPFTNYYSVYFRQYCGASSCARFTSHHLIYPIRYCMYYVFTRFTRKSDGSEKKFFHWLKRVFQSE